MPVPMDELVGVADVASRIRPLGSIPIIGIAVIDFDQIVAAFMKATLRLSCLSILVTQSWYEGFNFNNASTCARAVGVRWSYAIAATII